MANRKRSAKIEKDTRRLIESVSDLVRKKDNRYKFKGVKKKEIRQVKRSCVHWIIRKGKEYPAVEVLKESPNFWTCKICGKQFPITPLSEEEYREICQGMLSIVNQIFFYSVKMGGDSSDTKVLLRLKELLPKFEKLSTSVVRQLDKRQKLEATRREAETSSQFNPYSSYNYRT